MSWIFLILIGILFISISSLFQRVLLKDEQSDPFTYAIIFQLIIAILFFIYVAFTGFNLPPLKPLIPHLLLTSLLYALSNLFYFKGLKTIEVSESSILSSSKAVWTMLTATIFLGEQVDLARIAGMFLVLAGITVVSWKRRDWKLNKGHFFILTGAFFLGIAFTNDAFLLNHFEAPSYSAIAFLFPALLLLAIRPKSINKFRLFLDKKRLFRMVVASFLLGIGNLSVYYSYQRGGDASQIAPISQSSIIFVVILAFIFLKERKRFAQKVIGSLLVLIGVWLLVT
jgi:drug/metabolite transporter (DMT)-like permease